MDAATLTAFAAITAALIGGYGSLFHRINKLEGRVTQLTNLDRLWWQWAQQVISLYAAWRHPDAPELPPIPTEQTADES